MPIGHPTCLQSFASCFSGHGLSSITQAARSVAAVSDESFVLALLPERSMSGRQASVTHSRMNAQLSLSTACQYRSHDKVSSPQQQKQVTATYCNNQGSPCPDDTLSSRMLDPECDHSEPPVQRHLAYRGLRLVSKSCQHCVISNQLHVW